MKKHYLILLFSFLVFGARAQNYASFNDPRTWGKQGTPVFENVELNVGIDGLMATVSLTIELSAKGYLYTEQDSLEVILDFVLPDGAAITNSYLWVEGQKMEAFHLARNVATNIYEGIVQRRRDPLLLVKNYYGYQARIFPMKGNETRKFQIDYSCPLNLLKDQLNLELPAGIINAAKSLENGVTFNFNFPPNFTFYPFLDLGKSGHFVEGTNSLHVNENEIGTTISLGLFKTLPDYIFANHESGEENYFELVFNPSELLEVDIVRKTIVIIDYDSAGTTFSKSLLINSLISGLQKHMAPEDLVKVVYNNTDNVAAASDWFKVSTSSYNFPASGDLGNKSILKDIIGRSLTLYSDTDVTNYILLSSTLEYSYLDQNTNGYMEGRQFAEKVHKKLSFYSIGFANKPIADPYSGRTRVYSYNPFLSAFSNQLGGSFYYMYDENLKLDETLGTICSQIAYKFDSFQVSPVMDSGFTYSVMEVGKYETDQYNYYPIFFDAMITRKSGIRDANIKDNYFLVGKYSGALPIEVHISAEVDGKVYFKKLILNTPSYSSSSIESLWKTQFINHLDAQFNSLNREDRVFLREKSLEYHILSRNTAFLSLEPGMVPEDFVLEGDESNAIDNLFMGTFITGNKPNKVNDLDVSIFPNPASDYFKIKGLKDADLITVLTSEGNKVGEYRPDSLNENGFDVADLEPGLYIINIYWNKEVLTKKFIKK